MFGESLGNALGSLDKPATGTVSPALFPVNPFPRRLPGHAKNAGQPPPQGGWPASRN